jgi:hypothetical protein
LLGRHRGRDQRRDLLLAHYRSVFVLHAEGNDDSVDLLPLSAEGLVVSVKGLPESELGDGHSVNVVEGALEIAGKSELEESDWPAGEFPAMSSIFFGPMSLSSSHAR